MIALAARTATRADPLQVLVARAEARAILYREGEFNLHEAVDALQASAVQYGLVADLGQDAVQAIIAAAFATVQADADADVDLDLAYAAFAELADALEDAIQTVDRRGEVAKSTIDAAEYLVRQGDADRLRRWLDTHSAEERIAIHKHLEEATRCPRSARTR